MNAADPRELRSGGQLLDLSPDKFGLLKSSRDALSDPAELRNRMNEDGYLLLPDLLDRNDVLKARRWFMEGLAKQGYLDETAPVMDGIAKAGIATSFHPDLVARNPSLDALIYGPRMMGFFDGFLAGPARHFDFTWLRTIVPGKGSQPHCDVVFMGRGTQNLYTAWVPLGDVPRSVGGLLILENSHKIETLRETYCKQDVDRWCTNRGESKPERTAEHNYYSKNGALSTTPVELRDELGGRWLTADYRAGDVVVFCMTLVHGSLDNASTQIRLSSDSRYQLASEPVDERWIGEHPIGHGHEAQREAIC